MKTGTYTLLVTLNCFLVGSLVESSPLSSTNNFLSVRSTVGSRVALPCSWKSPLVAPVTAPPSQCHIQWATLVDTVFEQQGEERWQAEEFKGRVEVPQDKLGAGDCSLIINDAQIGDTGQYESFMLVDGAKAKTRVFIQSVKLSVHDHKSVKSLGPGEDLVLDLHTRHSVRVIFQGRNSSELLNLWMRGDANTKRLEKNPTSEKLIMRNLRSCDAGMYKVLDDRGLSVSTVQLSVKEQNSVLPRVMEQETLTDVAAKSSCSTLLILSVLVTSFQIPRLL